MRVLWVGDAVVSSGFAACTHVVCDELHKRGHVVNVLGLGYYGDPHVYPYNIWPCQQPLDHGRDYFGVGRLPYLVGRLQPDVIVILNDPWNIEGYVEHLKTFDDIKDCLPPIVCWLAVDAGNQSAASYLNNREIQKVVTWTQYGADELVSGGYTGTPSIVPLGVDNKVFYPQDKVACRKEAFGDNVIPDDSFVVGVVGRNQPRKRLDLAIEYFAEWREKYNIDNAYLLLHIGPTGDRGCDIRSLIRHYNLTGRVMISEAQLGYGVDVNSLAKLYGCMDVYMSTSQGEGWGLPALEAMACGVPCLLPGFASFGPTGWTREAAVHMACAVNMLSAPLNSNPYTIGRIPDKKSTVEGLQGLYSSKIHRQCHVKRGLKLASELTWDGTAAVFANMLEESASVDNAKD